MKKSLLFISVLVLSSAFALGQQSTVGQSTDQNTHDHAINPEQAQSQDANSGKSGSKAMVDDQGLHRQIHEQLSSNPAFQNVQVEVENGTAKLTGTVASKDDKKKAKDMAKAVTGVKKVKDEITVSTGAMNNSSTGTSPSSMGASTSTDQNTAGSISGNAGSSTATPSNSTPSSTTTPNSTSPNSNSSSTPTPPQTASAPSTGSDAGTTMASTATPDASAAAGSVAAQSSTTGMQSSGTQSSATPAAAGSSDQVKSDIQTALRNEPTLSSSSVTVDVSGDSIQLNGSANSAKDRDEAKRIAQSFAGNRRVVDNIKVSGSSSDVSNPSSTSPNVAPGSSTPGTTPNSTSTPNSTNPEQPSIPKN